MHEPINYELFARNLCWLQDRYAMPQRTLSALTGIPLPVLRMTERGQVIPRLNGPLVSRLCQIFDISAEGLLTRDLSAEDLP